MTRTVEVESDKESIALPSYLDTDYDNHYTRSPGVQESRSSGVQESRCHGDIGAPSTSVQELNIKKLQESWHRWNPPLAPMPDGPTAIWPELSLMIIQD